MTGRTHLTPPRLLLEYSQLELQHAVSTAQHLMQRKKPESLDYDSKGRPSFEQAKRTVLMERMVLSRFDINNFDYGTYQSLFKAYPHPLNDIEGMSFAIAVDLEDPAEVKAVVHNMSLKIKAVDSRFEHETIRDIHPINANDPVDQIMVRASSHALIEFVFRWCIHLADEIEEKHESPPLAALLKEIDPFRYRLSYHAEYLDPVQYFMVEGLIINPRTGFPFNVPQEAFPRTLFH